MEILRFLSTLAKSMTDCILPAFIFVLVSLFDDPQKANYLPHKGANYLPHLKAVTFFIISLVMVCL